jgi:rhodanese-related sulfurtransferase
MTPRTASALVLLASLAVGCTRKTSDRDIVYLTPAEAIGKSAQPTGLFGGRERRSVWVDPRTPQHYAEGHVSGAVSLPFPRMSAEAKVALRGYDQFFVYGTGTDDTIAKAASKRLMELGFDDVYTLKGGLEKWKEDGHEVVATKTPEPPARQDPSKTEPKAP